METANTIIKDALQEILVQASEQPIEAVDFQTAKRYLNRMMTSFAASGINLGFTIIVEPTDLVTVPDGALEGIVFNLAKRLLATYDMPLTAELALSAKEGKKAMRKLAITIQPTQHPSTLPIGSGNEGDYSYRSTHFYPGIEDGVLNEQDGKILLEGES